MSSVRVLPICRRSSLARRVALPMIWRNRVIGWANVGLRDETVETQFGYVSGRAPKDRGFKSALEAEVEAMRTFLD